MDGMSTQNGNEMIDKIDGKIVPRIPIPKSIYFGGAAWGSAFYIGVHQAMVEIWGPNFMDDVTISGDSAGVLWAVGIALKMTPLELENIYRSQSERAHKFGIWFGKSLNYLSDSIKILLSDPTAYKQLEGKFSTATTEFPFRHRRHWAWDSNDDLSNCMLGSLHVPMYSSCSKIRFKGKSVVDGAYSMAGTDLPHGDETLFVGIDPHAEITRELTLFQMIYPAAGRDFDDLVTSGYNAMKNWDGDMKRKVGLRHPNYSALMLFWPLKVISKLIRIILWMLSALSFIFFKSSIES